MIDLEQADAALAEASRGGTPNVLAEQLRAEVDRVEALRAELGAEVSRMANENRKLRLDVADLGEAKGHLESILRKAQREREGELP